MFVFLHSITYLLNYLNLCLETIFLLSVYLVWYCMCHKGKILQVETKKSNKLGWGECASALAILADAFCDDRFSRYEWCFL